MTVYVGGDQMFDALVYGQRHPGTQNFLERQMENLGQMSHMLTEAGQGFVTDVQNLFQQFSSSDAMRAARAAVRKVGGLFQRDEIRSMWELADIQAAPLVMQRWVMACPEYRELVHQQRADGFSETYVDMHPGVVGKDHYDYRRLTDGMIMDDEEHDWVCVNYFDTLEDGDKDLTLDEKIDGLSVHDFVRFYIEQGEDPGSQFGNKL